MRSLFWTAAGPFVAAFVAAPLTALAQTYPDKPIELICYVAAGSSAKAWEPPAFATFWKPQTDGHRDVVKLSGNRID